MNFTFDGNEWFMLATSAIGFAVILAVRKHFRPITFLFIWLFDIAYVETIDYALAGTPFQLYFCADNVTYEPAAAVIHVFLYPAFALLFLYFYDRWGLRGYKLALYYLGWTVVAVFFEWVNVKAGVFTYTGWTLLYSVPTYPISAYVLVRFYHFVGRHLASKLPSPTT